CLEYCSIVRRGSTGTGTVPQVRWLDQQQYLIETYRQIRDNLGQLEAEIEAARLRVTDWTQHRREPSRSRSLSHASLSTNASSSHWSCSTFDSSCTDASCLHIQTDSMTTGSSSCCSSACGVQLPSTVAVSLNAATLISAFLTASTTTQPRLMCPTSTTENCSAPSKRSRTPDPVPTESVSQPNRSTSPS
ncbi:hypothetical protein AHF37_12826, partial [Paragonimus kellicotti]